MSARRLLPFIVVSLSALAACDSSDAEDAPLATWEGTWQAAEPFFRGDAVTVRLARLEEAMCPRFHVDRLAVRVVSTFAGNGTEYLADEDVDRRWLGHAAGEVDDEASGLMRPGARVRRAEVADVLLLKGEAWPKNAGRGAVHRSPSASAASPRLVMTLDPL